MMANRHRSARASRLYAILIMMTCAVGAVASEGSIRLTREGVAALQRGDFDHALNAFELATRQDPGDAEAYFFYGVAHNRRGRHDEALVALNRAETLGNRNPRLALERGYALTNLGRDDAALQLLEAYNAAHPRSGIAKQLLARLYLRKGEPDRARALASEAKALDPALADTAGLVIAYAERTAGDERALGRYLEGLVSREPGLPFAARIQQEIDLARDTRAQKKPWRIELTAGAGYNDNVIAIGDGVPLPADISNEKSVVGSFGVDASYALVRTADDYLNVRYSLAASVHESDLDSADLVMHNFAGLWQHRFGDRWVGSMAVADQYATLGGDSFRNRVSVRPSMSYRYSDDWRLEGYVRAATEDYFFNTTAANDRDGENVHVGLLAARRLVEGGPALRFGAEIGNYATDGSNYDRTRHLFYGALAWRLPHAIELQVNGTFSSSDYDNLNSFTGFTTRRDDEAWTLGATAVRGVDLPGRDLDMEVFVSVDYVDNDSNIGFFDYDQVSANAGFTVAF